MQLKNAGIWWLLRSVGITGKQPHSKDCTSVRCGEEWGCDCGTHNRNEIEREIIARIDGFIQREANAEIRKLNMGGNE